jgi:ssDNA-binding Zn-finger/Zn-ribbon topoisomerase 1
MVKCPECGKEMRVGRGTRKTLFGVIQNHLWGAHNYPVERSHIKAIEVCRAEPHKPAPGERPGT